MDVYHPAFEGFCGLGVKEAHVACEDEYVGVYPSHGAAECRVVVVAGFESGEIDDFYGDAGVFRTLYCIGIGLVGDEADDFAVDTAVFYLFDYGLKV